MKTLIQAEIENYNASREQGQRLIIGIKAHKAESKERLKEQLSLLSALSPEEIPCTGAMCYSPASPKEETYEYTCPQCHRIFLRKVSAWGNKSDYREDLIQKKISAVVNKIRMLGYDTKVEHMCDSCYAQTYGQPQEKILGDENRSFSVLWFRFSEEDEYTKNVVSLYDCERLYDFLNGNNAYIDGYNDICLLKDCSDLIKQLLGI